MAYEQKDNSGSLFVNERKETDNHPDRNGAAKITCPHCQQSAEHWVNGWLKDSNGKKWLSLSFKPKQRSAPDDGAY